MSKPWAKQSTQLNTVNNTTDLITPTAEKPILTRNMNSIPSVPVVKRDPSPPVNTSIIPNSNIPNPLTQESVNNTISTSTTESSGLPITNNTNNMLQNQTNPFGSSYGSSYGTSYGGYGSSYGGYGSSYGGYGGYGSSYGGMYGGYGGMYGGMNRFGMQNGQENLLDKCFMVVERMNYQMFHFCEMARMIQAQSASLAYFLEILGKGYEWIKTFITTKSKNFYDKSKLALIERLIKIKKYLKEFFSRQEVEDSKLKSHIKALDYIISILLISALAGLLLKVY
jgi:hypothetical protein